MDAKEQPSCDKLRSNFILFLMTVTKASRLLKEVLGFSVRAWDTSLWGEPVVGRSLSSMTRHQTVLVGAA